MTQPFSILRWAAATESSYEPLAAMVRGSLLESIHRGAIVVMDEHVQLVGGVGDPNLSLLWRSAAKPFQALAVVGSGAADAFGFDRADLAIMCGSHAGRAEHVEAVERVLRKIGVPAETICCGPLTHMCSGKHAGMIAIALHLGVRVEGYELVTHPVQQEIARTIRRLLPVETSDGEESHAPGGATGARENGAAKRVVASDGGPRPSASVLAGTDGCGVPMVRTTIREAAYLYALLAAGGGEGLTRIRDAMLAYPHYIAGEGRLDTSLVQAGGGKILAKAGAEGIMALGFPSVSDEFGRATSVGCIIKIADGSPRALPALIKPLLEAFHLTVPEEALAQTRPRTPEGIRGVIQGQIVSFVEPDVLRRPPAQTAGEAGAGTVGQRADGDAKYMVARGDEKDILRFLREEWPSADLETFGRPLEWIAEPHAIVVRRHRKIVAVLRGHFTGGVASVDELMVARGQRGSGLGTTLLARFEAEAEARRCIRIVLRAVKNSSAESFYHNRGYHRECVECFHEFGYDYVRLTRELQLREVGDT